MRMPLSRAELDAAYPHSYRLLAGYFNQDWYFEYGSTNAALDAYVSAYAGGPEPEKAGAEIDSLLATNTDAQLEHILQTLRHSYLYADDGYTARTWLQVIRNRLRKNART